ncbi:MAG: hypothetical protein R3B90_01550 [Planctomycetaceae bacterium]
MATLMAAVTTQAADARIQAPADTSRVWIGADAWANRLQDWRLRDGRIECIAEQPKLKWRTLQAVTSRLGDEPRSFSISTRIGLSNTKVENAAASSLGGIVLGVGCVPGGQDMDHRSAALVHGGWGRGAGCFFGLNPSGELVTRNLNQAAAETVVAQVVEPAVLKDGVVFSLGAAPKADNPARYDFNIRIQTSDGSTILQDWFFTNIDPIEAFGIDFRGGVGLVSHPGEQQQGKYGGRWWFEDVTISGDDVESHPGRAIGPILSTMYTIDTEIGGEHSLLKLTAQLMPIGDDEARSAALQVRKSDGTWHTVDTAQVVIPGWTATFRDDQWDATIEDHYRVVYPAEVTGNGTQHTFEGTIRKDPVQNESVVVAGFTGNHMVGHGFERDGYDFATNVWFPHADVVKNVSAINPDVLFFSGDQVYEGGSPTFPDVQNIELDYLYKWYLWCWAYRDITRDRPTICEPDDHDVYQGNIWGQGGRKAVSPPNNRYGSPMGRDHDGGYVHPAEFVKMVERTQTSHLPDPYDPQPLEQGITSYYTDMVWGGIGMAILEDRKFKSGCNRPDMPPSGTGRPDHFNDPAFDVADLDIPGLTLLGDKQLEFLDRFATDWKGHRMKIALSQTIFANMATHHGGALDRLIADLDSNGWPQTGRNKAIDALRKGFVFHLAGDQHLATIVHHGVDAHNDAIWSFCVPSVANFYPRAWAPTLPGEYSPPAVEDYTGEHRDGFGHPVTVFAATNPGRNMGHEPTRLHNGMPGYGIVRLNKATRAITMECWPRFSDVTDPNAKQYEGWPKTISQTDNYARQPAGWLPKLVVEGANDAVVTVLKMQGDDPDNAELVYSLRLSGTTFDPPVFDASAKYVIEVSRPEAGGKHTYGNLEVATDPQPQKLTVQFTN